MHDSEIASICNRAKPSYIGLDGAEERPGKKARQNGGKQVFNDDNYYS